MGSYLEKCRNLWKNGFSGHIWPDWGNTAWADMAGLGSIEIRPTERGVRGRVSTLVSIRRFILDRVSTSRLVLYL